MIDAPGGFISIPRPENPNEYRGNDGYEKGMKYCRTDQAFKRTWKTAQGGKFQCYDCGEFLASSPHQDNTHRREKDSRPI